jgi:hypothetical protein
MRSSMLIPVLALAVASPVAWGQAKGQASRGEALAGGTTINAVLKSKLDTRHAKVGDRVTGQTTAAVKQGGRVVLPKGSKLYGRVTQVTPAANGKARATLGVLFYQAVTPKGVPLPMHAAITGLAAAGAMAASDGGGFGGGADGGMMTEPMSPPMSPMVGAPGNMAAGGGGLLGGVGGGVSGALDGAAGAAAPVGETAAGGIDAMGSGAVRGAGGGAAGGLLRASNGALFQIEPLSGASASSTAAGTGAASGANGMGGLATGAGASDGTLLTSQGGNLRFDSGSRMQLEQRGPGGSGAAASGSARAQAHAGGGR